MYYAILSTGEVKRTDTVLICTIKFPTPRSKSETTVYSAKIESAEVVESFCLLDLPFVPSKKFNSNMTYSLYGRSYVYHRNK